MLGLCGDLNADYNTLNRVKLNQFMLHNHLTAHATVPKRITPTSAAILDQFLCNNPDMVKPVNVEPPVSDNDHSTVLVTITFPCDRSFTYKRHVYSYSQANLVEYKQVLSNVDWDSCFQSEDINKIYENWSKKLVFS